MVLNGQIGQAEDVPWTMAVVTGLSALVLAGALLLVGGCTTTSTPSATEGVVAREAGAADEGAAVVPDGAGAATSAADGSEPRGPAPSPGPGAEPPPSPVPGAEPAQPDAPVSLDVVAETIGCTALVETTPPAYAELAGSCELDGSAVHLYVIPDDGDYIAFLRSVSTYPSSPPVHVRSGAVVAAPSDVSHYEAIAAALG